jgi:S1-C subfamily serine protease
MGRATELTTVSELRTDLPSALKRRCLSATIRIVNKTRETQSSGVVVGQRGPFAYALTARHVAQIGDRLEVHMFQPSRAEADSRVFTQVDVIAQSDETDDVAAIRILAASEHLSALPICPSDAIPVKDGFPALSIGFTTHGGPSIAVHQSVEAKSIRRSIREPIARVWSAADDTQPGRSGGPLVDRRGHVIGIQSGAGGGAAYFCHVAAIHRLLAEAGLEWLLGRAPAASGQS